MDLENIQREVHKIAEIVDEWNYQKNIPSLERDLVLEKLMSLYDMVRFSAKRVDTGMVNKPYAPQSREEEVVMQAMDLGEARRTAPQIYSRPTPATETPAEEPVAEPVVVVHPVVEECPGESATPREPLTEAQTPAPEVHHAEVAETPQVHTGGNTTEIAVHEEITSSHLTTASPASEPTETDPIERHKQKQRLLMSLYDMETATDNAETEISTDKAAEELGFISPKEMSAYDNDEDDEEGDDETEEAFELISVEETHTEALESATPAPAVPETETVPFAETPTAEADTEEVAHKEEEVSADIPAPTPAAPALAPAPATEQAEEAEEAEEATATPCSEMTEESEAAPEKEETPPFATTQHEERHTDSKEEPLHSATHLYEEDDDEEDYLSDEEAISILPDEQIPQVEEGENLNDYYRKEEAHEGAVLGEVINSHVQTLGDSLQSNIGTISEAISNDSTDDLMKAIGINDKFLMMHDLFGGDSDEYERVIRILNAKESLDDCLIYIAENFTWNPNSEGAKLLEALLERKFS